MKIQINDHRKIFALQEEFSRFFPNFKIEFLGKPSKVGNPPSEKMVKANKTLGDCRVVHNKGELTLSPSTTILDLKQTLADTYGLSAVFFRRSNDKWVEATDSKSSLLA